MGVRVISEVTVKTAEALRAPLVATIWYALAIVVGTVNVADHVPVEFAVIVDGEVVSGPAAHVIATPPPAGQPAALIETEHRPRGM